MHERSLMRRLIAQIEHVAATHGARRVTGVAVRVGALAHMSEAHFREHFEEAARGTIAEGATLRVEVDTDPAAPGADGILLRAVEVQGADG